jgi:hypothetical protein
VRPVTDESKHSLFPCQRTFQAVPAFYTSAAGFGVH